MSQKFYLCTAIAYVNGVPHLGHAMEFIEADAIARYKRLMGFDVRFSIGTDEYGVKLFNTAKEKGMEPQALADENSAVFRSLKEVLSISYDDFIRTTDQKRHWPACQKIWKKLRDVGDIYEKEYEGLYCEGCETFMSEHELVDGKCPNHKKAPTLVREKNYFFRLSKYTEPIHKLIEKGELKIVPEIRKTEFMALLEEGLQDVSFSRPREVLPWGVEVPDDPTQVMYVWCDALTNYISSIGYGDSEKGSDLFHQYWPCDLQVIGKDILRHHAGIWQGMLLSVGILNSRAIFVHGFIGHNGEKMSKSLGNVVDPVETAREYGVDALRYYLLREVPVGKDGDFTDELFIERFNSDLANNLGNLVNRVHTLLSRNKITDFTFDQGHKDYEAKVHEIWKKYVADMNAYDLHEGVHHAWRLIDFANKKMEDEKPWSALKSNPEAARATLCNLLEVIRHISILVTPFIPDAAAKIRQQIGLPAEIDPKEEEGWGVVKNWTKLGQAGILFPRIDNSKK